MTGAIILACSDGWMDEPAIAAALAAVCDADTAGVDWEAATDLASRNVIALATHPTMSTGRCLI